MSKTFFIDTVDEHGCSIRLDMPLSMMKIEGEGILEIIPDISYPVKEEKIGYTVKDFLVGGNASIELTKSHKGAKDFNKRVFKIGMGC